MPNKGGDAREENKNLAQGHKIKNWKGGNKMKRLFNLIILVAFFWVLATGSVWATTTYYVNPTMTTLDINLVISGAASGDIIEFEPGTYGLTAKLEVTESLTLLGPQAGVHPLPSRGSTRIPGDTSTEAILDGQGAVYNIIMIEAAGVTIDGLEIRNGTGDLIRQSDSYSGTIIRNCIVHDAIDDEGIQLANCTDGLIECNYVYDVAQDGANFAYSTDCAILNEVTSSNSENGAIFVYNSSGITIGCNYIHNTTANNGIKLYENNGDITVKNNLIVNNDWEIKSRHHDYSGNAILGYKPVVTGSTLAIEHNTISDNDVSPSSPYHYGDVNFGNGIGLNTVVSYDSLYFDGNVSIINNIITFNGLPLYGWGVITKLYYGCPGPTNCFVDYNDVYGNGAGTFLGTYTEGLNNIFLDPLFINPDYTLESGSPCIGTAGDSEDMGVLFDECGCMPPVIEVEIDIKPGCDQNTINLSSAGLISVAILSSDTFNATTVDPGTVTLAGAGVKMVGKSNKYLSHERDVNNDGFLDLVCQVLTENWTIEPSDTSAVLVALTYDGQSIRGEDTISIVPNK